MRLNILHFSSLPSPPSFQYLQVNERQLYFNKTSFLPSFQSFAPLKGSHLRSAGTCNKKKVTVISSLLESPILWAGRLCVFYALLKIGLAGSESSPFISAGLDDADDMGFFKWIDGLQGFRSDEKVARDRRKLVGKWHPTTKGTLRRNYRVPSKTEGRRLLQCIASLLSEDNHFTEATSHKGCRIRRESAHGEINTSSC